MREMFSLLSFDVKEEVGAVQWTAQQWGIFAFQYFVYGQLVSRLVVSVPNYYFYYGTGLLIIMTFNISTWAGRRFVEGAHEGRLRYILSLPLRRGEFFLEQVLLGLVVNFVRVGPPLAFILILTGAPPLMFVTSMFALLAMSAGIMGIMISLSFVAFKSFDIYSAIVAGMSALLIRFSTILYPIAFIPSTYSGVSSLNPITYGADLLRRAVDFNSSYAASPALGAIIVLAVAVSTLSIGMALVPRVLEGVKSS